MSEISTPNWTADQITLQQWLALPKKERKPKTLGELAKTIGVDNQTLYRWRKLAGFLDEVHKMIRDNLEDDLSDIYGALRREAKSGSFQHIRMALELVGDYIEQQRVSGDIVLKVVYDDRVYDTSTETA